MPDLDHIRATLARIPNPLAVLERLFAFAPVGFQIYEATWPGPLIVQQIARAHGGDVQMESRDGRIVFRAQLQR